MFWHASLVTCFIYNVGVKFTPTGDRHKIWNQGILVWMGFSQVIFMWPRVWAFRFCHLSVFKMEHIIQLRSHWFLRWKETFTTLFANIQQPYILTGFWDLIVNKTYIILAFMELAWIKWHVNNTICFDVLHMYTVTYSSLLLHCCHDWDWKKIMLMMLLRISPIGGGNS